MGSGLELNFWGRIVKISLFLSNTLIWISSIVLMAIGIWAVVDRPYLEQIMGDTVYISSAYILIAVGVLSFIVSFLGCFGAIKEVKCVLLMYFITILLLFIILLVAGILGLIFNKEADHKIKMGMLRSIREYRDGEFDLVTRSWDETQTAMQCCGIFKPLDWQTDNLHFKNSKKIPSSCCKTDSRTGKPIECVFIPTADNTFQDGCLEQALILVKKHSKNVGGAGIIVALLMILGLIFSFVLFKLI